MSGSYDHHACASGAGAEAEGHATHGSYVHHESAFWELGHETHGSCVRRESAFGVLDHGMHESYDHRASATQVGHEIHENLLRHANAFAFDARNHTGAEALEANDVLDG